MRSLSRQLIYGLLGTLLALLAGFCLVIHWNVRSALYEQVDDDLQSRAAVFIRFIDQRKGVIELTIQSFREGRLFQDLMMVTSFYQIWDERGATVTRSEALGSAALPLRYGTQAKPESWNLVLPDGKPGRAIGVRFRPRFDRNDPTQGPPVDAILVLAMDRTALDHALHRELLILVICGGGLLGAVAIAVPLVLRRGLRPLQRVKEQAERIDAASLSERFQVDAMPEEIQPITVCLNHLLARLENSFERERRFSSDVSHELLTPLAELRSLGEYALRYPDADSPKSWSQALEVLQKMESVIVCLVDLARAERGKKLVDLAPLNLAELVETVWTSSAEAVTRRRLRIELDVRPDTWVLTDKTVLRSIVQNLIGNAVNYADEGGSVRVRAVGNAGAVGLQIENPAATLSAGDIPHFFERFWRKDESRAGGGHAGLGLSLARELARLLGCELRAELSPDRRLTMNLGGLRLGTAADLVSAVPGAGGSNPPRSASG